MFLPVGGLDVLRIGSWAGGKECAFWVSRAVGRAWEDSKITQACMNGSKNSTPSMLLMRELHCNMVKTFTKLKPYN